MSRDHASDRGRQELGYGFAKPGLPMRIIHSPRLQLVPVTAINAAALWQVLQEPGLREFQDLPNLDAAEFTASVKKRPAALTAAATGRFEWLVYRRTSSASNRPLGWVSLRVADRTPSTGEIGYSIVAEHRGRGFATEAVAALVGEGFSSARLRSVRAYCVPENTSSRAVLERNGFESDGVLPRGATVKGQPVDVIAHTLSRQRWELLRKEAKGGRI